MRSLFIIISMIKVAILEYEKETKDIVFQLVVAMPSSHPILGGVEHCILFY